MCGSLSVFTYAPSFPSALEPVGLWEEEELESQRPALPLIPLVRSMRKVTVHVQVTGHYVEELPDSDLWRACMPPSRVECR